MQAQNQARPKLTAKEFWDRQAEFPSAELVDGVVTPVGPTRHTHGKVEFRIAHCLQLWLEARGLGGSVATGEVGYELGHDVVRGSDVSLHLDEPSEKERWETEAADVIVEVVSPNDSWPDIDAKADAWLSSGVREVWIANPRSAVIVVRTPRGDTRFTRERTLTSEVLPGFELSLEKVFKT